MKMFNAKTLWIMDAILLVAFLLAYFRDLTGLNLHQVLGTFAVILAAYHLLIHWDWVTSVFSRLKAKTSSMSRLYFGLDVGLFFGFFMIIVTGLVISSWLNLTLLSYDTWLKVHIISAMATMMLLAVKIIVHWQWISRTAHKVFNRPVRSSVTAISAGNSPSQNPMSRREFLRVAVPTGAVTIAAAGMAIRSLGQLNLYAESSSSPYAYAQNPSNEFVAPSAATPTINAPADTTASTTQPTTVVPTQPAAVTACTVRCNRGCGYPGRCRRYTDSNNNNRCDLGECL